MYMNAHHLSAESYLCILQCQCSSVQVSVSPLLSMELPWTLLLVSLTLTPAVTAAPPRR